MNNQAKWVTIPEETLHIPSLSADKKVSAPKRTTEKTSVQHRLFWGVGFVAVVMAAFAMLAPQQFFTLVQGNLFDAPGVQSPQADQTVEPLGVMKKGDSVPVTPAPGAEVKQPATQTTTVVQPETHPVTVSVKPLSAQKEEETRKKAEEAGAAQAELDANQKLLDDLKKQVADLKQAQAAAGANLKSSAPEAAGVTAALGSSVAQPNYRVNTHRVSVHPQTVLQQNMAGGYTAASAVNTASGAASGAYNASLSNVYGTPESGPREVMLIAFAMTFLAMMGWKARQLSRG